VLCQRVVLTFGSIALPRVTSSISAGRSGIRCGTRGRERLLFGALPAIQMARSADIGTRGGGEIIRARVRNTLVIAQVAVALVLLVASGLVLTSFVKLIMCRRDFSRKHVLTLRVSVPRQR